MQTNIINSLDITVLIRIQNSKMELLFTIKAMYNLGVSTTLDAMRVSTRFLYFNLTFNTKNE